MLAGFCDGAMASDDRRVHDKLYFAIRFGMIALLMPKPTIGRATKAATPKQGDFTLRYVFMDEAGTSALEPVTVVVAIVANADEHVMTGEAATLEALGAVPKKFQDGFVFRATQVFGDRTYQDGEWSLTERLQLLKTMMSIPRRLDMGIIVSAMWRGAIDFRDVYGKLGLSPAQSDHIHAFGLCVNVADRGIRKHANPREVATIVAEDVPEMRKFLKLIPKISREFPMSLPESMLRSTVSDVEAGFTSQSGDMRVTRIRNSIHFVEKADDPLVQVADACAYGFRRYFAGQKFGIDFAKAILGSEIALRNFATPGGVEGYWPQPAP